MTESLPTPLAPLRMNTPGVGGGAHGAVLSGPNSISMAATNASRRSTFAEHTHSVRCPTLPQVGDDDLRSTPHGHVSDVWECARALSRAHCQSQPAMRTPAHAQWRSGMWRVSVGAPRRAGCYDDVRQPIASAPGPVQLRGDGQRGGAQCVAAPPLGKRRGGSQRRSQRRHRARPRTWAHYP